MLFLKLLTIFFVIPIGLKFEYGITTLKTINFCSCSLRFVIQSEARTVSSTVFLTATTAAGWRTLQPSVWPLNSFSGSSTQVTQMVTSAGSSFRFLTVYWSVCLWSHISSVKPFIRWVFFASDLAVLSFFLQLLWCATEPLSELWYVFSLLQAFEAVEESYFNTIGDALAKKAHLSNYLLPHNEVCTHREVTLWYKKAVMYLRTSG